MNNEEIKPSLKEKFYQETLDEIAQKIQSGETDGKPRYWLNWEEMITVQHNMNVGNLRRFSNLDLENAVKLAIDKTYNEARSDAITEQDRYKIHEKYHELNDKDIEAKANTAKEIFKELAKICRQQLEPAQLERFAKEFFDAKDESEAFAIAQKFSKIVFYADEYNKVVKKWVD